MKYYKTGQIAKMSNLSIRTIRYYDSIGLLKPSLVEENGYRMYTDKDFMKLQKIMTLKNLGFSLNDIFSMTVNDSYLSLQQSLSLQRKMIDQKIDNLLSVKKSLLDIEEYIEENKSIDWSKVLESINFQSMETQLLQQYKDSTNINIRIRLHEKYSMNPIKWYEWLYSNYDIKDDDCVLELGCGSGDLWLKNKEKIPSISLTLSDNSIGMLDDAKKNLKDLSFIEYNCFDCHYLPYEDNSFDMIIANHVLFYLGDIKQALGEIRRVLKPGGYFYCSTYGHNHMKEITDIIKEYNPKITLSNINLYDVFGIENGKDILDEYFDNIEFRLHDDYLLVDNGEDITNYILSCHGNQIDYILNDSESFKKYMAKKTKKSVRITKEAGMFKCLKK